MKVLKLLFLFISVIVVQNIFAQNTFVDERDNQEYKTIQIGSQIWMAENLKYLPKVSPSKKNSEKKSKFYVFNYSGSSVDEAKQTKEYNQSGVLYNFKAAEESCPIGWRLPTNQDWEKLALLIVEKEGGKANGYKLGGSGDDWDLVGINLKSSDLWVKEKGKNNYGFNAVPSGSYVPQSGRFFSYQYCAWWSSTGTSKDAYYRSVFDNHNGFTCGSNLKSAGISVRCIKDEDESSQSTEVPGNSNMKKECCSFKHPSDPNEEWRTICEDDDLEGKTWKEVKSMVKEWGGTCTKK